MASNPANMNVPSRSGSIGNGPPSASIVGPPSNAAVPPPTPGGNAPPGTQNLNQIVIEYLHKKGYSKTEAALRKEELEIEKAGQRIPGVAPEPPVQYERGYKLLEEFVDDAMTAYRPELIRLLWPIFVHCVLNLAAEMYTRQCDKFYVDHHERFVREHEDELRDLKTVSMPEHMEVSALAKAYRGNKYRLSLTSMAYNTLLQYLESKDQDGGGIIISLIHTHIRIISVSRADAGPERSLAALLSRRGEEWDRPLEDEGIPGHDPGRTEERRDPTRPNILVSLSLGPYSRDSDFMEDVRADLEDEDKNNPPEPGEQSLVDAFDEKIKQEPTEDGPKPESLPLPPPLARDVAMEVQKVREHRDRFRIDARTGGMPSGTSVCMYTFHNTFDSINCIDFSPDLKLIAAGSKMSYIQVWSIDGSPIPQNDMEADPNAKPVNSKRLIGHSGPVYAVSFAPGTLRPSPTSPDTSSRVLLSSSADKTVRLWSLEDWNCLVVYRAHDSPIWDVKWSPHGYYFLTCGHDRSARIWAQDRVSPLRMFVAHDSDVDVGCWHPNGAYVFTAGDKNIRMWDLMKGTAVRLYSGHTGNITAIECSPNGSTLASADDQGAIFLWDLKEGTLKKRMRGHGKGGIWSLSWSVESSVIVSGGADNSVRVWDATLKQGQAQAADGHVSKVDGISSVATGTGTVTQKKSKKDVVVTPDQISAFPTKKSPVYKVFFSRSNLVLAGSAYMPEPA